MSEDREPVEVEDAKQLLQYVELDGIETYEVRSRLVSREASEEEFEEGYQIKAGIRFEPDLVRTRFTLTFDATTAEFVVDMAVRYRLETNVTVPQAVAVEFAERVGVMAAWPFLREHIFALATRLGVPVPVLGLLRQGDFSLTPDEPSTDTASVPVVDQ